MGRALGTRGANAKVRDPFEGRAADLLPAASGFRAKGAAAVATRASLWDLFPRCTPSTPPQTCVYDLVRDLPIIESLILVTPR